MDRPTEKFMIRSTVWTEYTHIVIQNTREPPNLISPTSECLGKELGKDM